MIGIGEHMTLSIVVPLYNESENITDFYSRLTAVLSGLTMGHEIICVNDGSTDNTLDELLKLRQRNAKVKIINFSRNFGKEVALTAGIDFSSGEAIIPIDADLQDPPEVIPSLIAKWREGFDVVYATRKSREGESWLKRISSHLFYRAIRKLTSVDIPRDTGDFRLITREVAETLKHIRERNRFMKGLFSWVGFKQTAVYYNREPRNGGKTKWNYWKLWNFALEGVTSFSYLPLQFATYFGLLVSLVAFIYALIIVIDTLLYGNPVPGYPSLLVLVLFLGGVQLFVIGLLGEYIGRIYYEVKRRPLYLIRETFGLSRND